MTAERAKVSKKDAEQLVEAIIHYWRRHGHQMVYGKDIWIEKMALTDEQRLRIKSESMSLFIVRSTMLNGLPDGYKPLNSHTLGGRFRVVDRHDPKPLMSHWNGEGW